MQNSGASEGIPFSEFDSFEEDEIEDDSREEAEVVPETQPFEGDRVIPTRVEPINVARVGGLSNSTLDHYLHLCLGPMNSTNADDIPSKYGLTGERELELRLKFLNKDAAMLAIKNYNIRRSEEFKVVESDHTRYVCRCKLFGDQCCWMVRVAKTRASRFWEIRKYQGPHSCLASATSQDYAQLDSNVICQHIFPHGSGKRDHLHQGVAGICGAGVQIQGVLQEGLASEAEGNSQNLCRLRDCTTHPGMTKTALSSSNTTYNNHNWLQGFCPINI
ncbi:hypothetical protein Ahy_A07g036689 isoform A [Arachis hypogaea]|uniref:Transposase MuDR plant domain-containing protein n=1 Tax=Arachis hypogaea TaxID=3818 RepID=A0A445CGR5_ARAHY|nr:hypothetical protein Ahy_A07g036689 isoform A [Arachis hypogaea]